VQFGAILSYAQLGSFDSLEDFEISRILTDKHLVVGLKNTSVFSELNVVAGKPIWSGYDVDIMKEMAHRGGFTFTFQQVEMQSTEQVQMCPCSSYDIH
jgi:hypothetical protein